MIPVTILHEAELELWTAITYYEEQGVGLGADFGTEIERTLQTIQESPARRPLRDDGTRRCLTQRFPCVRSLQAKTKLLAVSLEGLGTSRRILSRA